MPARKRPRTPGTVGPQRRGPMGPQDLAKAAALKRFRETAELTQVELAEQLGISQNTLSGYENGRYVVPDDILQMIVELANAHAAGETGGAGGPGADGEGVPLPGPGAFVPPAGDRPPSVTEQMGAGISAALSRELSANQKRAAQDLAAMYQLLGTIVANMHQEAGGILYGDAETLAQSAILAAEESPLIKRFVELFSQGAVFQFAVLHALTAMKIEAVIREQRRARQNVVDLRTATEAAARAAAEREQEPAPEGAVNGLDPLERYRQAVA